jgi:NitT/TauT family transport system substrate-binding protein
VQAKPGLMVGSYIASEQYVRQHADVVKSFRQAVTETAKAIADNPDAFRQAQPKITTITPEAAAKLSLPAWKGIVDTASLTWMADHMKKYGLVDKSIDVTSAVASGAAG